MNVALEARPAFVAACVLAVAAAPWLCDPQHRSAPVPPAAVIAYQRPMTIEPPLPFVPLRNHTWRGEPHPDAQPWPRGMVITPPATNNPMVLWHGSTLDILLSALIAPLVDTDDLSQPSLL